MAFADSRGHRQAGREGRCRLAVRRLLLGARLDLGLLLGVLFVMTIKPGVDEQGALAVAAAIPAAFAVLGVILFRLEGRGLLHDQITVGT